MSGAYEISNAAYTTSTVLAHTTSTVQISGDVRTYYYQNNWQDANEEESLPGPGGPVIIGTSPPAIYITEDPWGMEAHEGSVVSVFIKTESDYDGTVELNFSVEGTGENPADPADFADGVFPSGTLYTNKGGVWLNIFSELDGVQEGDEEFKITFTDPDEESSDATDPLYRSFFISEIQPSSLTATILSGSIFDPGVYISAELGNENEGNGGRTPRTFTVTREFPVGAENTSSRVSYVVSGAGTNPASASDFVGGVFPTGTVDFQASETTGRFTIFVKGDTVDEPDETFMVSLTDPINAQLWTKFDGDDHGGYNDVLRNIFDDDYAGSTYDGSALT
jgi:hypothetical protein